MDRLRTYDHMTGSTQAQRKFGRGQDSYAESTPGHSEILALHTMADAAMDRAEELQRQIEDLQRTIVDLVDGKIGVRAA